MTIVIAGKNNIAVDILEYIISKKYKVFVIFNKSENFRNGFQKSLGFFSNKWNIKNITLEEAYKIKDLIFLSLEFDQIIKPKLFKSNNLYNIHFSYLPSYKGVYTSTHPILNNEMFTGVTFHKIDEGIDTGDIIFQKKIKIFSTYDCRDLYSKYILSGTKLIIDNFNDIINSNFSFQKQGYHNSSYYSKSSIDYKNLKIDFNKSAFEIFNQIRAFSYYDFQLPKFLENEIIGSEILKTKSSLKPQKILSKKKHYAIISTIDFDLKMYFNLYNELWDACKIDDIKTLKEILNLNYLDLDFKSKEGWTALIISVYNSSIKCIKELIRRGADVNEKNYNNTTVLMYAISSINKTKRLDIIKILVKFGANIAPKDYYDKNVLDWTVNDINIHNFFKKIK